MKKNLENNENLIEIKEEESIKKLKEFYEQKNLEKINEIEKKVILINQLILLNIVKNGSKLDKIEGEKKKLEIKINEISMVYITYFMYKN